MPAQSSVRLASARFTTLLLALALTLAGSARAADIFVPGDHATIQAAIDAAVDGDTIHIGAGTWPGALQTGDRDITLIGAGADLTIVDGQGAAQTLLVGSATGTVFVQHLTLTGGITGAATAGNAFLTLTNTGLRGNSGVGGGGRIHVKDSTISENGSHGLAPFLSAVGCTIRDNGGWGVEDLDGILTGPVLNSCSFSGNAFGGARLAVTSPSDLLPPEINVVRCTFASNDLQVSTFVPQGSGIAWVRQCSLYGGSVKLMQGNVIAENSILRSAQPFIDFSASGGPLAQWSNVQGFPTVFNNIDADPLWADPEQGDFSLLPGSPCINAGKPPLLDGDGTPLDLGALPYDPWTLLGEGVAGSAGTPRLQGTGAVQAGFPLSLQLANLVQGNPTYLVVGLSELAAPFKGGTLWPAADLVIGLPPATAGGTVSLGSSWPAGLPSGFTFWSQAWSADNGAPLGWAASNAVRGVQP